MTVRKRDVLLTKLETEILTMLGKTNLTPAEKLKAIEAGAKVLMIRHKISEGSGGDGAFFAGNRK